MIFFIGMIINKSFVLFTIDYMNHLTFKLGRATPETTLQPFLGWPAHSLGSLWLFSTPRIPHAVRAWISKIVDQGVQGLQLTIETKQKNSVTV
jgi:hypothetical protein